MRITAKAGEDVRRRLAHTTCVAHGHDWPIVRKDRFCQRPWSSLAQVVVRIHVNAAWN
jgi:hypothetical protein